MPDPKLIDYIKKQLAVGQTKTKIKDALLKVGWKKADIDSAFNDAETHDVPRPQGAKTVTIQQTKAQQQPTKHSIFDRIGSVLFHPKEYFQDIKSEEDFWTPVKYQIGLAVILAVFYATLYYLFFSTMATAAQFMVPPFTRSLFINETMFVIFFLLFPVILLLILILIGVPLSLLMAGYMHLFIRWFGGKGSYVQTLKAASYASTPALLLSWVPIVNFIASIWSLILQVIGISELHEMSTGRAVGAVLVVVISIIVVIILLWFLFMAVFGLAFLGLGY